MDAFREIYPEAFFTRHLEHEVRPDGRGLTEVRPTVLTVQNLSSENTLGSSFVKQGGTTVIGGVKGTIGPLKGMEVHVELSPLSNGERPGLPSAFAVFLKQKMSDLLFSTPLFDTSVLVVDKTKQLGWNLHVDLYCVDDDGAVFDVVLIAAIAALKNTQLPNVIWSESSNRFIQTREPKINFEMFDLPSSLSFCLVDHWLLSDPSHEEESVSKTSLSVVWHPSGRLRCVEKRGGSALTSIQLQQCMALAKLRCTEMTQIIEKACCK